MNSVAALSFREARSVVLERTWQLVATPSTERVLLAAAAGRVLAEPIAADRDLPPTARSMRDGYALHASDLPGSCEVVGEVRAGGVFRGVVQPGEAVEIMTGAMLPDGADTVVMVEHVRVDGSLVRCDRRLALGANVCGQGADARQGDVLLRPGQRIGYAETALLAAVGAAEVAVYRRLRVAILATGDELVDVGETPAPRQIRNSNAAALAVQVARAGGDAVLLPVARDNVASTRELIHDGLECDLLLVSGGVSAGRYDVVESVLAGFGAEFFFTRVKIQPGQPCVFGQALGVPFFGLPGNPASTLVCFEVLARAALEILAGQREPTLAITEAPLAAEFHHQAGLTRFLPARLGDDGRIEPVKWSGSGDLAALTRANCYLVADAETPAYRAGDRIGVLLR